MDAKEGVTLSLIPLLRRALLLAAPPGATHALVARVSIVSQVLFLHFGTRRLPRSQLFKTTWITAMTRAWTTSPLARSAASSPRFPPTAELTCKPLCPSHDTPSWFERSVIYFPDFAHRIFGPAFRSLLHARSLPCAFSGVFDTLVYMVIRLFGSHSCHSLASCMGLVFHTWYNKWFFERFWWSFGR